MTEREADQILIGIFVEGERAFLFQHEVFKNAIAMATRNDVLRLSELGSRLLLEGDYKPGLNYGHPN